MLTPNEKIKHARVAARLSTAKLMCSRNKKYSNYDNALYHHHRLWLNLLALSNSAYREQSEKV
jgi:hypothetical protein